MNKYKYLFKNVGLLTISNFGSKLLSFFLVPLYTSLLTTVEYGTYDLINTTVGLLVPLLTLNIIDSTLRFSLDDDSDLEEIISIGFKILLKGSVLYCIIILLNKQFGFFPILNSYRLFFSLSFFCSMILQMMQAIVRGLDKVLDMAISGVLNSIVLLSLNVFFLLKLKWGLEGYFYANIISSTVTILYLAVRCKIYRYIRFSKLSKVKEREMLSYSKPLILNSVSWWINNMSDRYIVIAICGIAANGIYSVGYKIPSILSVIQTIFNQAWQLSTVSAYDEKDSDGFFKNIYSSYNFIMVVSCSIMIMATRISAYILYSKEFFLAWKYVPFLMIAIVFGSLSGVLGGVFQAVKDSKIQSSSTTIGAMVNVVLNVLFVWYLGPIGAAIATTISYFLVWLMRLKHVKKYMKIQLNLRRDFLSYSILLLQTIIMLVFSDSIMLYAVQFSLIVIIFMLYREEILMIFFKIKKR